MELPIAFENRMKRLLGNEYDAFWHALQQESAVKGLRVNTAKATVQSFLDHTPFPLTPLPYAPDGFIVSDQAGAGKHPYHHAGAYYMQDPGAMATVCAIPSAFWERKGLRILDLCAAPGGKTTQLASLCAPLGGAVLANEYNAARSRILAGNVERMGLSNVCVTNLDSKYHAQWYPSFFDLVVVDAPCSGEGMYRKNEQAIEEWSPQNVQACATRQKEILENAAVCVAGGGYLLYSTCTYATEENEEIISAFLLAHPEFRIASPNPAILPCTADGIVTDPNEPNDLTLCRRFYPHRAPGEGQFVALLEKQEDGGHAEKTVKDSFVPLARADAALARAFMKETLEREVGGLGLCGGNAVLFPVRESLTFPLPPFGIVTTGAALGEIRKGRIVPHHHFFSAYGNAFRVRVTLRSEQPETARYLMGEEIEIPTDLGGYAAVLLELGDQALSLGGGKAVNGRLKNYYPKGLRIH